MMKIEYTPYFDPFWALYTAEQTSYGVALLFIIHIFLLFRNTTSIDWSLLEYVGNPFNKGALNNFHSIMGPR